MFVGLKGSNQKDVIKPQKRLKKKERVTLIGRKEFLNVMVCMYVFIYPFKPLHFNYVMYSFTHPFIQLFLYSLEKRFQDTWRNA